MSMFCYQCEQTAKGTGCTIQGVCGKDHQTAALQDLLIHVAMQTSQYAHCARGKGKATAQADRFVVEALFTTITNVDFDPQRLVKLINRSSAICDDLKKASASQCQCDCDNGMDISLPSDLDGLVSQGKALTIQNRIEAFGPDISGLQELILYGLKGMAAYVDHAHILGYDDDGVYAFIHEAMNFLAEVPEDIDALVAMSLRVGEVNLTAMELLDTANTTAYGHPEPTEVRVTPIAGKAILVSGHDLKDLQMLLEQTEGKGINVYTHGEMLPCNAYPKLKKYSHLAGNYGGAWQDQRKEFDAFPGAILMTTNCIMKPKETYAGRIFTTGLVAFPGVGHIDAGADGSKDFSAVIASALEADGFAQDEDAKSITIGFAHDAVMSVAPAVIDAVKAGAIKHFFLIGGCDGAKSGRNYYTELAQAVPDDCVILTLACGKYRFNKLPFGDIGGIPRLLDCGQCNDAYSAIQIAVALAGAFECGVNELPLSIVLSWYEQKAVCVLLTLLHLGIKDMRIGPSLPAFVGPNVLNVLVETFGLTPITTAEADIATMLGN